MSTFLGILALLFMVGGLLSLSNATVGVGCIGAGAVLAIIARMAQADRHHAELLEAIRKACAVAEPPTKEV